MPSLRRLLSHGFFPHELPQAFTSRSLARLGYARAAPAEFTIQEPYKYPAAQLAKHNLARKGKLRRVLGIPNPLIYYNTAREVISSWPEIEAFLDRSKLTATRIVPDVLTDRGLAPQLGPPDLPRLRAKHRTNRRYLLHADILQFYPSLYTHSIPWALHGKPIGKSAKRDWKLLGNRLDYWMRQAQHQQTGGVPIGPDTSRLAAEIVLVGADLRIHETLGEVQGFRALDDYELSFRTRSEAESALAVLQSVLAEYELQLNESKTGIQELPIPLNNSWPLALREFEFKRRNPAQELTSLAEYFNLAFEKARSKPAASVLRYAVARASGMAWSGPAWMTYQDLLLQCATAEPGVLKHVTAELKKYQRAGEKVDTGRVSELVELTAAEHVPLGHGSEVVWAIWLAVALRIPLSRKTQQAVSGSDDPLVPLVALHAKSLGLTGADLDTSQWEHRMTKEDLEGPQWLLAYEAGVRNWLPTRSRKTHHVDQDPRFRFLRQQGVRFYNTLASAQQVSRWKRRMPVSAMIGYDL